MRLLARAVVRHPWLVVGAWIVAAILIVRFGPSFSDAPHSSLGAPTATVVTEDGAGAPALRDWLTQAPGVTSVSQPVPSADDQAALMRVTFAAGATSLDSDIAHIEAHLAGTPAAITGDAVASHDFNVAATGTTSSSGVPILRLVTILIVLAVLALVYRAPLAVLVPLLCVGASFLISPHLAGGLGELTRIPVSDFSLPFMFTVTLGAGTNYGLFLISRYREILASGADRKPALEQALAHTGEAIVASAGTVVVGTSLMAFASFDLFRSLGPAVAVAVATTLVAGLTLLPALIAICGRAFFWPRRPARSAGPAERGAWRRIGDLVVHHPAWMAAASAVVLLPAAASAAFINLSFDILSSLPSSAPSVRAQAMLGQHFAVNATSDAAFKAQLGHDFTLIAVLVGASILIILIALLRDLVAPLYLIATVGLSTAVAIGLTGLVSDRLFHQPLFWTAPVFAFVFLVALGEDFNIFLVTRLRHEVAEHGPIEGIARAVGATGGVITSCGLVMASAFLLLARSDLAVVRQIGLVVMIGVLLDTFLIRPVLVPSLARLLRTGVRPRPRSAGREEPAYDAAR